MDIRLALMVGSPIPIPECQITIHQPTLEEISYLGEEDFFKGVQTLSLHKSMFIQDETVLKDINNFQIFMMVMTDKQTVDKKHATLDVLKLFFPNYKTVLTPQSLLFIDKDGQNHIVDANNFEFLQEAIRKITCANNGDMSTQAFNPGNAKAKEIADKIMRGRQRVAALKGAANASIFSRYLSVLTIGLHTMSLFDLIKCTMFQLYDLIERYSLNINWDLDIRTRLAGGKPDTQPENWMKDIH